MKLSIENTTYIAMGCQSDANRHDSSTSSEDSDAQGYPNHPRLCNPRYDSEEYTFRSYQEIQPRWLCDNWTDYELYQEGHWYDCWYAFTNMGLRPLDSVNIFEEHPHQYKPYISIIFQDTPYIPDGNLVLLNVSLMATIGSFVWLISSLLVLEVKFCTSCCKKFVWLISSCFVFGFKFWTSCCKKFVCLIPSCFVFGFKCCTSCCRKTEKAYDSDIVVEDKLLLLKFAMATSSNVFLKRRLVSKIEEYIN